MLLSPSRWSCPGTGERNDFYIFAIDQDNAEGPVRGLRFQVLQTSQKEDESDTLPRSSPKKRDLLDEILSVRIAQKAFRCPGGEKEAHLKNLYLWRRRRT